jgi:hypothetical protein
MGATGVVGFGCDTSATRFSLSTLPGVLTGFVVFGLSDEVTLPVLGRPKRFADSEEAEGLVSVVGFVVTTDGPLETVVGPPGRAERASGK